jgi:quercetin dioxygenase-like cupin family protein
MFHETEEFFVLLEGSIEYYILNEDNVHIMQPGDTLYMKPNLPHKVRLTKDCDYAKALITYSSGNEKLS